MSASKQADTIEAGIVEVRPLRLFDSQTKYAYPIEVLPYVNFLKREVFASFTGSGLFRRIDPAIDPDAASGGESKLFVWHSPVDYHADSFEGSFVPNLISDLVLCGRAKPVRQRLSVLRRERAGLRRRLMYRVTRIRAYFEVRGYPATWCVAYRGELSLPGRFPNGDIDLLLSVGSISDYEVIREDVLELADALKFAEVDWIEVHPGNVRQKRQIFPVNSMGSYRLDCYATVGELELDRIAHEDPREALWTFGVLKHSKPLLNQAYLDDYIGRFELEVASRLDARSSQ